MTESKLDRLRQLDPDAFRMFLRDYLREGALGFDTFPPNERVPQAFAITLSRDSRLRDLVRSTLPELIAELGSQDTAETLERAMTLFGYCRVAQATRSVVALCDELERREKDIDICLRALAAQLPTEPMLELLLRKGIDLRWAHICLRALLRLDRARAARLFAALPKDAADKSFLESALRRLSADEVLDAAKELYLARPTPHTNLLARIESVVALTVLGVPQQDSIFTIFAGERSLRVVAQDTESRNVLCEAEERTSLRSMGDAIPGLAKPLHGGKT